MSKIRKGVSAANKINKDSLTAIFDQYATGIFRYTLRLCGDPLLADQIVGDVFSNLLEKVAVGEGPRTNVRSYLFQSAYHAVVDRARVQQRMISLDVAQSVTADGNPLPKQLEERILLDELQLAIERDLTEEQRHVIVLRFQEEFSLRETAEIMEKSINAVKVLQNRAVTKLRQSLSAG